jgi:hypothetical protein
VYRVPVGNDINVTEVRDNHSKDGVSGDKLKKAYLSGGAGTYTRSSAKDRNWKKQKR